MTAHEEEYNDSPKRLTEEELEKHIARLTAPPRPVEVRDPFPVCPTVHLSQAEVDKMTERLYTESLQQREANRNELEKRLHQETKNPHDGSLTTGELQGSVDRLYAQSVERKKESLAQAKQRYDQPPKDVKKVPLNEFVQHMYYDRREAKKKTEEKLYQKYIVSTELHCGKISPGQLAESANRLSTKS